MRGDQAKRVSPARQSPYESVAADVTLAVIRPPENLIDQKHYRQVIFRLGCRKQQPQPLHLGIKIREPVLHGVAYLDAGEDSKQRSPQALGVYRRAGISQAEVHAHGPEERALAGHIRSGKNHDPAYFIQLEVITDFVLVLDERMSHTPGFEYTRIQNK